MLEKDWPNFSKNLISKIGNILSLGKINYTNGPYGIKFEKEFSNFVSSFGSQSSGDIFISQIWDFVITFFGDGNG